MTMAAQPKLRPLKTAEEVKAIPANQPVLIALPAAVSNSEPEPPAGGEGNGGTPPQRQAPAAEGAAALEQQLKALKDARAADAARLTQAERDRDAALARAREAEQDVAGAEQRAVTTGLAGAQADLAAAKQALKIAFEAGDAAAMADAQEKIGRSSAKVLQYEQQGAEVAQRVEEAKRAPPQAQTVDPMAAMESNPQLYPQEKDWFRRHPETWTDRRMNVRLEDGYFRAMDKGLTRGTPEYFAFLDQHMGYAAARTQNGNGAGDAHDGDDGHAMAAAPVSRENGSMANGQTRPGEILITPEEREIAESMGISPVAYAEQKLRMAQDKKARPEAYYIPPGRN